MGLEIEKCINMPFDLIQNGMINGFTAYIEHYTGCKRLQEEYYGNKCVPADSTKNEF